MMSNHGHGETIQCNKLVIISWPANISHRIIGVLISKHEKRAHSCNCNKCMNKFRVTTRDIFNYFSSSKTDYYCGFREADFLDFYFFSYSNISFIASVCDKKTKTKFLFCCCCRNSWRLPLLFPICDNNKNKELWTLDFLFGL